ncbi:aldo/keto reductase [Homoserinibacter sp. GY 40078]|uniref:aldo/keto reductase family protein n=1 Tax=Homoserinibacter sp. GY 40078 TaxID=2603275 RepID=UPI0011C76F55|nr:aldo/keto reductase [Homoserinibacter sp. GY 40078]TXK20004.1 aldo/keto reductase [Homoserinibacter sp. GY 40078]
MPVIGTGTFGSDRYGPAEVSRAVAAAIDRGYRLIDCASVYGNEPEIGEVLSEAIAGGVPRGELFVMSKVWNDAHSPEAAIESVRASLRDLRLDYLDAVFIHWPFPNHHAPFASTEDRDPHARPYAHAAFMAVWRALESLVDEGVVRHLGTSNMTIPKLRLVLRDARIAPSLNEMELHPTFQQPELFRFCLDHDIQPVGYSPLGSPSRPARDRTEADISDIDDPVIRSIAEARGVHPVSVCLQWAISRGQIPIPFAVKPDQIRSNLDAATAPPLTPEEIEALRGVDRNNRLIKGQVFLWPGAGSYLDLWDVDGTIPGWQGYGSPAL